MVKITESAASKLKALILEHPEDPIVRLAVTDLDEMRLQFRISLESDPQPDDDVQECMGLTVAVDGPSVVRMDGITLDYAEPEGFRFLHPDVNGDDFLRLINPN